MVIRARNSNTINKKNLLYIEANQEFFEGFQAKPQEQIYQSNQVEMVENTKSGAVQINHHNEDDIGKDENNNFNNINADECNVQKKKSLGLDDKRKKPNRFHTIAEKTDDENKCNRRAISSMADLVVNNRGYKDNESSYVRMKKFEELVKINITKGSEDSGTPYLQSLLIRKNSFNRKHSTKFEDQPSISSKDIFPDSFLKNLP